MQPAHGFETFKIAHKQNFCSSMLQKSVQSFINCDTEYHRLITCEQVSLQIIPHNPVFIHLRKRVVYELTNFCTFKPITFIPCITLALILPPWWDEHTLCMWMTRVYSVTWYWNIKHNTTPYQSNIYIFGMKLGIMPTCETLKWIFRNDIRSSWMRQIQFSDPIFYLMST